MSFILDALRKSDAQRRRGVAPALVIPQAAEVSSPRPRTLVYVLLATALIGAGIVIGSVRPWQTVRPPPAPEVAAIAPRAAGPELSTPAVGAKSSPPATHSVPPPASAAIKRTPPRTERKIPAQDRDVVRFSELPVSVQREIPALSITAHAYSPVAKDRLVGINEQVLREGDQVTPNLLLERITLDGMILSYKGYRFRRGVR